MNPETSYTLAIDQGTLSSRTFIFDQYGQVVTKAQRPVHLSYINDHFIEQDAEELIESVKQTLDEALGTAKISIADIHSCGIATQRSSILAWSTLDGRPLSPILSWQDTRAADWLNKFNHNINLIRQLTGLPLSPHYGVSKIHWLLEHQQAIFATANHNEYVITPVASFLLFHISQQAEVRIDIANASRTLLTNLIKRDYDQQLLKIFGIPSQILARCDPCISNFGKIHPYGIPIRAMNGDQTAALYHQGTPNHRHLHINLGTGAFVLLPVDLDAILSETFNQSGLLAGISNSTMTSAEYFIEGTVNGAGAAIEWLDDLYPVENIHQLIRNLHINPNLQTLFINSIGGLGSPYWRTDITPRFHNDSGDLDDRLQAVLESIVFLLQVNIESIRPFRSSLEKIEISGGLSEINYLGQCLANLSGIEVLKNAESEATARGIAWLASMRRNNWRQVKPTKSYIPQDDQGLAERYRAFSQALRSLD